MPNWSTDLPKNPSAYAYNLIRTPADTAVVAVVTSDSLIGCNTHYWGGRTVPCEYDPGDPEQAIPSHPCPACAEQSPTRWYCYLSVYDLKAKAHCLFECTAKAAQAFEAYRENYGTVRGCYFSASRPKRRKNSPVHIITKPADLDKIHIPPGLDIPRAMAVIWQLPGTAIETPTYQNCTAQVALNTAVLDRMHGRAPSSNGKKKQ